MTTQILFTMLAPIPAVVAIVSFIRRRESISTSDAFWAGWVAGFFTLWFFYGVWEWLVK